MSVPDDEGGREQLVGSEEDSRVTQWLHQRVDEHVCRRHKNSGRLSIGCTRQMQGIGGASGRSVVRFNDAIRVLGPTARTPADSATGGTHPTNYYGIRILLHTFTLLLLPTRQHPHGCRQLMADKDHSCRYALYNNFSYPLSYLVCKIPCP